MQIYIKSLMGRVLLVSVDSSSTVHDVKMLIEGKVEGSLDRLALAFQGTELDDERALTDYNIEENSTLELQAQGKVKADKVQGMIKVIVKMMTTKDISLMSETDDDADEELGTYNGQVWKDFTLKLNITDTISTLKSQIAEIVGIKAEHQAICHKGILIAKNHLSLGHYDFRNKSIVYVFDNSS